MRDLEVRVGGGFMKTGSMLSIVQQFVDCLIIEAKKMSKHAVEATITTGGN